MVDVHHEITEMDLNPVIAGPGGAVAVDYRIRLRPPRPRQPLAADVEMNGLPGD